MVARVLVRGSCHVRRPGSCNSCHIAGASVLVVERFREGTARAIRSCVPPSRRYTDLAVWKLADELRVHIFQFTSRPKFAADPKARSQVDDAINSVCRNIAEGFGCRTHAEFATFLTFSRRSLNEVQDAMRGAQLKGYVTASELEPTRRLAERLYLALSRFIGFLRRTPNPPRNARKPRTEARQPHRTDPRKPDRTDKR